MLKVVQPSVISSPVAPLVPWIPRSLANVAPELTDEMNELLEGYTLEILDERSWICSASVQTKTIRISTRAVEIIWAQASAAYVFYNRVLATEGFDGSTIDITDVDVLRALEGYRWALQRMGDDASLDWPASLPRPSALPALDSDDHVSQELALVSVGFLLLHEVAHVALEHSGTDASYWSVDQERDADAWAADWVLVRGGVAGPALQKRGLGVALALLVLVSSGIYTGGFNGITHPRDFDRLFNALAHRIPDDVGVWEMVLGILCLHLTNVSLAMPVGPYEDAAEAADACFNYLAGLDRG